MKPRSVLVCGGSLLLSGVAASLKQCPDLRVEHAATWEEGRGLLDEHTPDAVIIDLTDAYQSRILPLWLRNPSLVMLGLDPESNRAVLLAGQDACSLTLSHIKEMIGVAE
jgi:DNA-binding NarL/FixJ family response regulator